MYHLPGSTAQYPSDGDTGGFRRLAPVIAVAIGAWLLTAVVDALLNKNACTASRELRKASDGSVYIPFAHCQDDWPWIVLVVALSLIVIGCASCDSGFERLGPSIYNWVIVVGGLGAYTLVEGIVRTDLTEDGQRLAMRLAIAALVAGIGMPAVAMIKAAQRDMERFKHRVTLSAGPVGDTSPVQG